VNKDPKSTQRTQYPLLPTVRSRTGKGGKLFATGSSDLSHKTSRCGWVEAIASMGAQRAPVYEREIVESRVGGNTNGTRRRKPKKESMRQVRKEEPSKGK